MTDDNSASKSENIIPDRLRHGIQEHQKVMQSSVKLLKEVGDVNDMMQLARCGHQAEATKIQRLIVGFEAAVNAVNAAQTSGVAGMSLPSDLTEIQSLLMEFEHLNESQVLRESLENFNRARDSLEKVLGFLEKIGSESSRPSPQGSQLFGCPSASRSLREKIEAFNKVLDAAPEKLGDTCRHFKECFCSCCTLDESFESKGHNPLPVASKTNSGYEGDIDSEVEQPEQANNESKADR
ncbi:GM16456 [Drosophila sechellia]|uniref:GM16456 n=1 Tax=Drosophila sechellia TaxID=7238 RepID=B4IJ42_DROSE|nr:GM16456 [Drosophila sechellia]